MPSLPAEMIVVLAPFAQLFSDRVWLPCPGAWSLGAILAPGARTVTSCLRVMGLAAERHFTNYHRVLNRATWSALQASQILLGLLVTRAGAARGDHRAGGGRYGGAAQRAADQGQRLLPRCGALLQETRRPLFWAEVGGDDALGAGALGQRVWALPFLTALCWPPEAAAKRRHKTSVDWVRQMMKQVRRWLPGRLLVLVVDGGFAAVVAGPGVCEQPGDDGLALALGCRALSPARAPAPRQARPQAHQGQTPTQPEGLGGPARIRPGRTWRWTGTGASANSSGSSRAPPCGTPRACPRWRFALSWCATPRANCAWPPSSVPTCRPPRSRSCMGRHALVGGGHL